MRSAEILDSGGNATIRLSVWTEVGGWGWGPILRGADTSFRWRRAGVSWQTRFGSYKTPLPRPTVSSALAFIPVMETFSLERRSGIPPPPISLPSSVRLPERLGNKNQKRCALLPPPKHSRSKTKHRAGPAPSDQAPGVGCPPLLSSNAARLRRPMAASLLSRAMLSLGMITWARSLVIREIS